MLQDFQRCDRLKLNSLSVAPLRWTLATSFANEVLWKKTRSETWQLRWTKLTSFSNEIFGKACDLNLYTDLTPALNAVHFVCQRSPRDNLILYSNFFSCVKRSWLRPPTKSSGKTVVLFVLSTYSFVERSPLRSPTKPSGKTCFPH